MPAMGPGWNHGNITRSKAEELLSRAGKDGSFLVRASESIPRAYALCVLFRNCVYTYRILPNEDDEFTVQASEGVPMRFFTKLDQLIEFYKKENMGLVTHLQYPVPLEEEDTIDEAEEDTESVMSPPELPPRNIPVSSGPCEAKDPPLPLENPRAPEVTRPSLSETLFQRLQSMDTSGLAEEHLKAIQDYLSTQLALDADFLKTGSSNLPHLKKLTSLLCKELHGEVVRTLPSLESLQRLFDQQLSPGLRPRPQVPSEANPINMVAKLSQLTSLLSSIEDKVKALLHEGPESPNRRSLIPPVTFEVKSESLGIPQKMHLKVDVESGKLIIKKSKDGSEDKFYSHKKILQLIKSQKFLNKLVILVETEKEKILRKEYVFADSKKREGFCQLLQQMKNKHSEQPEPDMITIFIGTWNMGNAPPPKKITSWFLSKGQGKTRDDSADYIPHDIYVIGTQEDPLGEKEWLEILKHSLQEVTSMTFKTVAIHTLWNIRIVVLAKPEHENRISHICTDNVKTGIANTLGNKGAVGVSFMFNGTSLGFVNSHLTSGSEKKLRRNQNYMNILRFLALGDKKLSPFNITHRFTHLFWLGDLNYRVELPTWEAETIIQKIKQQQYSDLLAHDQLLLERKEQKVFLHFEEEEITFAPTYRFERLTRDKYAYTKQKATGMKYNLPSWCDRVLWKSYPLVHVVCQSYGSTSDIMTSDHSPVFATFEAGVTSQFVSKNGPGTVDSQGQIEFLACYATLKTKSQTKFYLEFHSSCLESFVKSQEGENEEGSEGELVVRFGETLPKLKPIISDPEYLLDQHILISIKSSDSDESYGEGCIALHLETTETQLPIYTPLTHHGEMTGHFRGEIKLQTSQGKMREKLYDFVKTERDEASGMKCLKNLTSHDPVKQWEPAGRVPACGVSSLNEIINPNYIGVGPFGQPLHGKSSLSPDQQLTAWSYDQPPKDSSLGPGRGEGPPTPPSQPPLSPKKFSSSTANRGLCSRMQEARSGDLGKVEALLQEDLQLTKPEMFENPLYGSVSSFPKVVPRKEQESPKMLRKEPPPCPDPGISSPSILLPKVQEVEGVKGTSKQVPVPVFGPTPRMRSFTCSSSAEGKVPSGDKNQGKPKTSASTQAPVPAKRPIKPSRSEMSQQTTPIPAPRPPLPVKSPAVLQLQHSKSRDYRDNTELPHHGKHRHEEGLLGRTAMQ
ncbi:phosphatidylinositol 3,4,5-trisphosphate 5-phosphatase 1 isoform X8 [Alexandromys fortis]|uniref:phosphatidylinositol 3,4,5-trisphosphate 5-phosphatase 1 isoform X1 n=1 Tax=Alexandromys fortis TaxID=100897 RepID=UPI002152639A|nr:phosphatidylinositol 3,4,5-trisphosphate 5-phosphatase 1 isoform X1 [Microtus fortis]XP_049979025.1 phosphatidylinositol 3,4,5-trisphosphate 5-phosphatase 1 isoform X2 [Microtus fortis]XP_049979026.1 phosphatidylinositol 3,4,5-trisphosphate 5-phosphatase 1 isoform X3 [Microtus fortis]XP_049979027.1 phosphatidylinositol 3,4,5-trisphosphate 5-phosphatase 1 isoform X4 [Microtus fortis]XP_049979029.1 phosphatidylinositol 3,4,5-trisphosphate 5-phosphatase 1 isoform X5 [Microtus fortis]XP_0499790